MTVTESSYLQIKYEQGVATLILNRPDCHNAFDDTLIAELSTTLQQLEQDNNVRVVILTGNGKSFSAGADLQWMQRMANYSETENVADAQKLAELMHTLYTLDKPTIALVQGAAFGGAVGLVACCDIAIASEKASFCLSEVKLGLIPAVISPYVIAAMGERAARRYMLTAERFSATEAQQFGLVHQVVTVDALEQAATDMTRHLLSNGPNALIACKQLIANVTAKPINAALQAQTAEAIAKIRVSPEGQAGLSAFLNKQKAPWASRK